MTAATTPRETIGRNDHGKTIRRPDGMRAGGLLLAAGAVTMLLGALAWAASGADLDAALVAGDIDGYLTAASESSTALRVNLSLWIIGVLLMGMGGTTLADGVSPNWRGVARFAFTAGPAAAIVFFSGWLALVVELAPAHVAGDDVGAIAQVLGQTATIADWIATTLIVSIGALALGRSTWAPRWLRTWSLVSVGAGAVAIVSLAILDRNPIGFIEVPVGVGFMIAAGITASRRSA